MSSKVPGEPYFGPVAIDVSSVSSLLFDIPPGSARYLRPERPGIAEVIHELATNFESHGANANIAATTYEQFIASTSAIDKLRDARATVAKLLEVLNESEAKFVHERENAVSQMADAVRSTAKRTAGPSIVAPFEKLLAYNAQVAQKAAKTRRRNAKAALEATETDQPTETA